MADKKISQLTAASQVNSDAVFPLSQIVSGSDATVKATVGQVGDYIADEQTFAGLNTSAKDLIGAINEIAAGGGGGGSRLKQVYSVDNSMTIDSDGYITNNSVYGVVPVNSVGHEIIYPSINAVKSWAVTLRVLFTSLPNGTRVLMGNNSAQSAYYNAPSVEMSPNGASIIGRCSTNGWSWTHSITINHQLVINTWYSIVLEWDTLNLTLTLKDSSGTVIDTQTISMTSAANMAGTLAFGTIARESQYIASNVKIDLNNSSIINDGNEIWKTVTVPTNPILNSLYEVNESQGGVWINTGIAASDYSAFVFVFNSDADDYLIRQVLTSNIAVYTGGQDVYTTIFNAATIVRDFNVRIYNNELYVSFNGVGSDDRKVMICVPAINIITS